MTSRFVPYASDRVPPAEMRARAESLYQLLNRRRSVRDFATDPVPREMIELAVATASTAPSGAHRQPWRFVAVDDPAIKRRIRLAAEEEERAFYAHRATDEWRQALEPLGTDWQKPFLEEAPWLVVAFEELYAVDDQGNRIKNYYVKESVGLACGLFIVALHNMGLVTLTHTPSPMAFLSEILGRPDNERPFILFPVGYPAPQAQVPDLRRKPLSEVLVWNRGQPASSGKT